MDIDLTLLHNGSKSKIDITGTYQLPSTYYENTEILDLSKLEVEGYIEQKENDDLVLEDYINCKIKGEMTLQDSISLEEVSYPFIIEFDDFLPENMRKSENILDIFAFLWENTVLEVPLRFTKVRDLSKFHGDGWRLIEEEDRIQENNPFRELLKDFEEE